MNNKMSVLKMVESNSVFSIYKEGDKFEIKENCHKHYSLDLTKEEVIQMAVELIQLANK